MNGKKSIILSDSNTHVKNYKKVKGGNQHDLRSCLGKGEGGETAGVA